MKKLALSLSLLLLSTFCFSQNILFENNQSGITISGAVANENPAYGLAATLEGKYSFGFAILNADDVYFAPYASILLFKQGDFSKVNIELTGSRSLYRTKSYSSNSYSLDPFYQVTMSMSKEFKMEDDNFSLIPEIGLSYNILEDSSNSYSIPVGITLKTKYFYLTPAVVYSGEMFYSIGAGFYFAL